jgi:hypothetical protein
MSIKGGERSGDFAFLAITFWSKDCVITGMEGLMSSGSLTNVTGSLFSQEKEHTFLDCPHEHLVSLRTQHHQLVFPPEYENSPTILRTFLNQIYMVWPFL